MTIRSMDERVAELETKSMSYIEIVNEQNERLTSYAPWRANEADADERRD